MAHGKERKRGKGGKSKRQSLRGEKRLQDFDEGEFKGRSTKNDRFANTRRTRSDDGLEVDYDSEEDEEYGEDLRP